MKSPASLRSDRVATFPGLGGRFHRNTQIGGDGRKYDPSRAGDGAFSGRPVAGPGDRAGPPGFAGAAGWRPAVVAAALSSGSARRSIGGPGHNDGRSRTPHHSRPPGKTVDAVSLRGSPSPPFRRDGTTATRHGGGRSHLQRMFGRFFGWAQKPDRRLTVEVFPFRLRPHPTRASAKPRQG